MAVPERTRSLPTRLRPARSSMARSIIAMASRASGETRRGAITVRVASLQKATKAFRAVAPLPRRVSTEAPSTGYDDVKLIALAALLVDGVGRVQVDWRQQGAKLSQVALLFGANDLDHVPATDDAPLGPRRAPLEEVRRNIVAASLTPVARTARFDAVPAAGDAPAVSAE